jgi:hypothetical protein
MEMVWCKKCKTVIWAYDHVEGKDRGGIANQWNLPCPLCGSKGFFGGWYDRGYTLQELEIMFNRPVYDAWSAMRAVAEVEGLIWDPSGDNTWFRS